ncbi:MAG: FkbM family methyltransferase [Rhizobiales bacterium]|nr:FkbM family methyltransferase [Hyphomicrobiales bacterium]
MRAIGFDPLVAEIDRLNGLAPANHLFEAAFVGSQPYRQKHDPNDWWALSARNNQPFPRTSAPWATDILQMDWTKEAYNANAEVCFSERLISLDDYCAEKSIADLDFIKIDTDGSDFEVLTGAEHILNTGRVLGVQVEAQFHGAVDREANLFSNIDTLLREKGFTLFDMDLWRYSRANLPRRFFYDIPAQTQKGQVLWGEALYLRDFGDADYERKWQQDSWPVAKLIKLAALFDLYGLPDCALELLEKYCDVLTAGNYPVDEWTQCLVPPINGQTVTLAQYRAHCEDLVRQKRYKDLPL